MKHVILALVFATGSWDFCRAANSYSPLTCEFDLLDVNIDILDELPIECKTIHENDPELFQQMRKESKQFGRLHEVLEEYKRNHQDSMDETETFRRQVYSEAGRPNCTAKDTHIEHLDCLMVSREAIIAVIEESNNATP